jgi:origin recognition complex subunit 2
MFDDNENGGDDDFGADSDADGDADDDGDSSFAPERAAAAAEGYFLAHGAPSRRKAASRKRGSKSGPLVDAAAPAAPERKRKIAELDLHDPEHVARLLRDLPEPHVEERERLFATLVEEFPAWNRELRAGFSLLLYGFGSKKTLLDAFAHDQFAEDRVIVINGFHPLLTAGRVVAVVQAAALEGTGRTVPAGLALRARCEFIGQCLADAGTELRIVLHNIDGPGLRNLRGQRMLSEIAAIPRVRLAASIDHVKCPLYWDSVCAAKFNFVWHEAATYAPYALETAYAAPVVAKREEVNIRRIFVVLAAVTRKARGVYALLARWQLDNPDRARHGLSFHRFHDEACRKFLADTASGLRQQITEFVEHQLMEPARSDGEERFFIPFDEDVLNDIIAAIDKGSFAI